MAWTYLIIAGIFEIAWAVSMPYTAGFTRLWPSLLSLALMICSVTLLNKAIATLPVGTAYAVWVAIGTVGAALLGMILFGESSHWPRLLCIAFIAGGAIGLKLLEK